MASKLVVDIQVIVTCPSCGSRSLFENYSIPQVSGSPQIAGDFKCCECEYSEFLLEEI